MRRYETIFIVTPDTSEEDLKSVATKFRGVVSDMSGLVVAYTEQGKKKLAYDVKKQDKGYYVLMDFVGSADLVAEIERNMRLDDRILKYLTVKLEDMVDPESLEVIEPEPPEETESAVTSEPEKVESPEVQESEEAESPEVQESEKAESPEVQESEEAESPEAQESEETKSTAAQKSKEDESR